MTESDLARDTDGPTGSLFTTAALGALPLLEYCPSLWLFWLGHKCLYSINTERETKPLPTHICLDGSPM